MQKGLKGTAVKGLGETASQLALTPLSVAGWSRLQLGAAHWTTSIAALLN